MISENQNEKKITRLDAVMALLDVSAKGLAPLCGVSNSLISRWQRGSRPLTMRSEALVPLAEALLSLDRESVLEKRLAPFRSGGETAVEALCAYLTDEAPAVLPARAAPPPVQRSGDYEIRQQALLGTRGFHKAALLMLDYLQRLPSGQRVTVCAHGGFDLWHANLPFALQFLWRMGQAVKRDASFVLVSRRDKALLGSPFFSVYWLTAHLRGTIRSRTYAGDPPPELFVGVIPGYWSGRAERDDTAEDGFLTILGADPRTVRKDEAHCAAYLERSVPASQYGFLKHPQGSKTDKRLWEPGPLPRWREEYATDPDGSFSAICRVPSFGVMTKDELAEAAGKGRRPAMPDFLFREDAAFSAGPHRLILCREDVREGLLQARRRNEPLSALLRRDVYVASAMLAAQLRRVLAAMEENEAFEVAFMPRSAFTKLELELVQWRDSASLAWLQNGSESLYDCDRITASSFDDAVNYTWSRLQKGWKQRRFVLPTLRGWLAGKGLDTPEKDSAIVRNWELLPRE